MHDRTTVRIVVAALAASVVFASACGESGGAAVAGPAVTMKPRVSFATGGGGGTVTVWDFTQIAGGDGVQGNPATFTIAGQGSIVATTVNGTTPWSSSVTTKGFEDGPNTDERGLGVCQNFGVAPNPCGGNEVGTNFGDGEFPSLVLNFTGLASGSVVQSVTLSSVQFGDGYSVSTSTDGSTYTLLASGNGQSSTTAQLTIAVPAGVEYMRFDPFSGTGGDDYTVETVSVLSSSTTTNGKTFSIGPSSMEGDIYISNGDWVNGGYSFSFANGNHIATNFFVHATVSLTGPCVGGGPATDTFTFALNDATYAVPANNTAWLPTGDQNSVLSWEGSVVASGVCGGIGKLHASQGAVFTATVSQNPATGSLVNWRFKYRDPAAKGKPNTNCLDTSDPNRAKADVCGASWSQTVRDP